MNLEKMIQNYKTETKVIPREEKELPLSFLSL